MLDERDICHAGPAVIVVNLPFDFFPRELRPRPLHGRGEGRSVGAEHGECAGVLILRLAGYPRFHFLSRERRGRPLPLRLSLLFLSKLWVSFDST